MNNWFLEGYLNNSGQLTRLSVDSFPFVIGRSNTATLTLETPGISRSHAELVIEGSALLVRDLGSINGTQVNDESFTGSRPVNDGDILTIAQQEFRIVCTAMTEQVTISSDVTRMITGEVRAKLVRGTKEFRELMSQRQLTSLFQPIVTNSGLFGYEALARGSHHQLSSSPAALFTIAESIGQQVELSELCRERALEIAASTNRHMPYFFNIHPAEFDNFSRLLDSVAKLREQYRELELVFEVHEEAVTDIDQMWTLSERLQKMGIKLAYDDFGAGQTRLMELIEVPAHYVKFDISLIRNIHQAPASRQEMVEVLIKFAQQAGSQVLAEGVETREEAEKCRELGFDLYQGYFFGKPEVHQ